MITVGEAAVKTRKVVSFSAKVKSSHVEEQPGVNDYLLQAVIAASKENKQFKHKLMNELQNI